MVVISISRYADPVLAGSRERRRFLSFPCLGLDRSGTAVRRVTLSFPVGVLRALAPEEARQNPHPFPPLQDFSSYCAYRELFFRIECCRDCEAGSPDLLLGQLR